MDESGRGFFTCTFPEISKGAKKNHECTPSDPYVEVLSTLGGLSIRRFYLHTE
jgi:hypothetical protein